MPGHAESAARQAVALLQQGDLGGALGIVSAITKAAAGSGPPDLRSARELTLLASVLFHCNRHGQALGLYRAAVEIDDRCTEALRGIAMSCRALGQIPEAERVADQVLARDPGDYEILHLRSSLRRQTAASNHVAELQARIARGIPNWRDAVQACYALAKELEDLGSFQDAFDALSAGAAMKRSHMQYDVAADVDTLRQIAEAFDARTVASLAGSGQRSATPIFILGLPRTGSTLVERIVSSHPEVESCGESTAFALEMMKLVRASSDGGPVAKARLPAASTRIDMRALGANYLRAVAPLTSGKRHCIDKMPMNSLNVGLIHLALPDAKIVLVERDAADCCLAMYRFLFRDAYPFSYDQAEVARYFVAHQALMEHWSIVLPAGKLLRLRYEDLVRETEGTSRRLLAELGLPWHDECLQFAHNTRGSATGSAVQVRQPIYASSIGAWRHHGHRLTPMLHVLREAGIVCDSATGSSQFTPTRNVPAPNQRGKA